MKKIAAGESKARVRSKPEPQVIGKRRKPIARREPADDAKREFIGRLKGVIRIVGDIESPVVPAEAWECCREDDLERINQAAERLNSEASDALDYQAIGRPGFPVDAKKRGRGRPRHTQG